MRIVFLIVLDYRCNNDATAMITNILYCVLSVIQGIALYTGILPFSKGRVLQLVKAQICVDLTARSEKSSWSTGRTTMGHVLAQYVAVEGLENEIKSFWMGHGGPKNVLAVTFATAEDQVCPGRLLFFVVVAVAVEDF